MACVSQVKSGVKFRTSADPELLIMSDVLLDCALAQVHSKEAAHARTFDDLVPEYRARPLEGPKVDQGDAGAWQQGCIVWEEGGRGWSLAK